MCTVHRFPAGEVMETTGFGEWLRRERKSRRLTLEALAERTGGELTHVGIGDWERGKRTPRPSSLDLLVAALAGPDATPEEVEALRREALAASVGLSREIERVPVDDPDFWDAYEGAPQEDRELAKQLLIRARDRERARTIGGTGG